MNNDLISRVALSEELSSLRITITGLRAGKGVLHEFMTEYRKSVLRIVDEAPAIDAEPVRHGRWMFKSTYYDSFGDLMRELSCSNCGRYVQVYDEATEDPYCPNCGAKMDEEVQHD